ncbi:hypothetical protein SAMN04487969_13131 [Paenibacillus algorifonticola]|uniref:Uncharacterized protein n=1 Tax=Paenibacillus algorifonticola TaxID=684063 RepID=A0A1I2I6L3_9BACL|nr:hypothetical protein SAMN04487969_13131 [Paenibacillus algorifonticola]
MPMVLNRKAMSSVGPGMSGKNMSRTARAAVTAVMVTAALISRRPLCPPASFSIYNNDGDEQNTCNKQHLHREPSCMFMLHLFIGLARYPLRITGFSCAQNTGLYMDYRFYFWKVAFPLGLFCFPFVWEMIAVRIRIAEKIRFQL